MLCCRFVKQDQVVVARLETAGVICMETFTDFPRMARFILRDEGVCAVCICTLINYLSPHRQNHCYWKSTEVNVAVSEWEWAPSARPLRLPQGQLQLLVYLNALCVHINKWINAHCRYHSILCCSTFSAHTNTCYIKLDCYLCTRVAKNGCMLHAPFCL